MSQRIKRDDITIGLPVRNRLTKEETRIAQVHRKDRSVDVLRDGRRVSIPYADLQREWRMLGGGGR